MKKIQIVGNTFLKLLLLWGYMSWGQVQETLKVRSPFADTQELTSSDYLAAIDRANDLINNVHEQSEFRTNTLNTFKDIHSTNATINSLAANIKEAGNTNLRNQRMYEEVLLEINGDLKKYQATLDAETSKIISLKKYLRSNMKDSVFRKLVRDSVIRVQYQQQLTSLRAKFFDTDNLLKNDLSLLNSHKAENTRKKIVVAEAIVVVEDRLEKSGVTIFQNECQYLWNTPVEVRNKSIASFIAQKFSVEANTFGYYAVYNIRETLALLLFMGLFLFLLHYNLKSLRTFGMESELHDMRFRVLHGGTILPAIVVVLNVAIAINHYAPALYIEFLIFLLLAPLSILLRSWPAKTYRIWLLLVALFAALSFIDLFLKVTLLQRCLFIVINILCLRIGISKLRYIREELFVKSLFNIAKFIFIVLNILAILLNLFGRVSLAYTLSLTAIIAMTQIIALSALVRIVIEVIVLQVYASRLRRGIMNAFEVDKLEKNIEKPFLLIAIYLWGLMMASNLNLSDNLYTLFENVVNRQNKIGSFTFSLGGILLFVFIIWIAHLLQKLAAYFFGGIEGEFGEQINKAQVSRLLITRLTVLVAGYLLALAASGMPLDKITIILGALGVGIGLGLQSVVSNFVGGVILIFERPIQVGDMIDSGPQSGRVKEIGLRTTRLQTQDGAEVIIPNGNILAQNIINWTRTDNYRQVAISFNLTGNITTSEIKHTVVESIKLLPDMHKENPPEVFFDSISGEHFKVKVRFWCNIYRTDQVTSEVRMTLFKDFSEKDILMQDREAPTI